MIKEVLSEWRIVVISILYLVFKVLAKSHSISDIDCILTYIWICLLIILTVKR
ncbi:hypothetical protein M0R19_05760 [Candidatus Pacearchaeota archaeon]|nr:hypothetical protein [Candidatus Pacearchaeota archaeon]